MSYTFNIRAQHKETGEPIELSVSPEVVQRWEVGAITEEETKALPLLCDVYIQSEVEKGELAVTAISLVGAFHSMIENGLPKEVIMKFVEHVGEAINERFNKDITQAGGEEALKSSAMRLAILLAQINNAHEEGTVSLNGNTTEH